MRKSYGIALCRLRANGTPEILLIKKRFSYEFHEFVLGKYRKGDQRTLIGLFNGMTIQEKLDIIGLDFSSIWYRLWGETPVADDGSATTGTRPARLVRRPNEMFIRRRSSGGAASKRGGKGTTSPLQERRIPEKYQEQKREQKQPLPSTFVGGSKGGEAALCAARCSAPQSPVQGFERGGAPFNRIISSYIKNRAKFESLLEHGTRMLAHLADRSVNAGAIWEIPKGRGEQDELHLDTALREFEEETTVKPSQYTVLWDIEPITVSYVDQQVTYVIEYYVARALPIEKNGRVDATWSPKVLFSTNTRRQEVECTKWVSAAEIQYLQLSHPVARRLQNLVRRIFKAFKRTMHGKT